MSEHHVSFEMDLDSPPCLSDEQKTRLAQLAARSDADVDYSDIPPLANEYWERAVPLRSVMRPENLLLVGFDPDVLA